MRCGHDVIVGMGHVSTGTAGWLPPSTINDRRPPMFFEYEDSELLRDFYKAHLTTRMLSPDERWMKTREDFDGATTSSAFIGWRGRSATGEHRHWEVEEIESCGTIKRSAVWRRGDSANLSWYVVGKHLSLARWLIVVDLWIHLSILSARVPSSSTRPSPPSHFLRVTALRCL